VTLTPAQLRELVALVLTKTADLEQKVLEPREAIAHCEGLEPSVFFAG